jgi:hypothetical protein
MTPAQVLVPALALELAPGAGAGACDAIEEIEDEYPFGVVPAMELSLQAPWWHHAGWHSGTSYRAWWHHGGTMVLRQPS